VKRIELLVMNGCLNGLKQLLLVQIAIRLNAK